MIKLFKIIIVGMLMIGSIPLINAQKAKKAPQLYFNNKKAMPAMMDRDSLLAQLSLRFWANDSTGKMYMVSDYSLGFVERGLYFDEEGKPIIAADYYEGETERGAVSDEWIKILQERLKSGDTIKISNPIIYTDLKTQKFFYGPSVSIAVK